MKKQTPLGIKRLITLYTDFDYYEITAVGTLIVRVTHYLGDTNIGVEIPFHSLNEDLQNKVQSALSNP